MSYSADAKTVALWNLSSGGTNLGPGGAFWNLTPVTGGGFSAPANVAHMVQLAIDYTVEREVTIPAGSGAGTILELGAWGETESVNIQCVIGWGADRRLFVGWERGEGTDHVLTCADPLPTGVPLRVAVTVVEGRTWIAVNGSVLVQAVGIPASSGGGGVGSITPGMTLSVGRRVSTADPMIYAGGGWLRVSNPRTFAEIRDDWEASFTPPAPAGFTWDELARMDGVDTYYAFRGRYRHPEGAVVAWATRHVHTNDGLLEGRILEAPGPVVRGLPETASAQVERVSTSLVLNNTDGALTEAFAGGVSTVTAYQGDSILNLTGKLYLGFVGPDGVPIERAITPTLSVVGSPTMEGARLTLPLATADRRIFGPTRKLVTVGMLAEAVWVAAGEYRTSVERGGPAGLVIDDLELASIKRHIIESLDATIPYAYGNNPIRMTLVSDPSAGWYLGFVSIHDPDISWSFEWALDRESKDKHPHAWSETPGRTTWTLFKVKVRVELREGETLDVWMVGVAVSGELTEQVADDELWLTPAARARIGMPAGSYPRPGSLVRQIISDLSEDGASAVHTASLARVDAALPLSGTCGGTIGSTAAISEILTHLTDPYGIGLWVGVDDKVHACLPTGWSVADVTGAAAESIPALGLSEIVEGTWSERTPAVGEWGGAATSVSVDWTSEQTDFWPKRTLSAHAPGVDAIEVAEEIEARISGAWVYPPKAQDALQHVAGRRAYVHRRVSLVAPAWVAALEIGTLVRLSHPWGAQPGGYARRLARLVRVELVPGEAGCRCELVDLDAYERMRVGMLDTAGKWILYDPAKDGASLDFIGGSATVAINVGVADPSWVGASLWTFGATDQQLRQSWRIATVLGPSSFKVDRLAPISGSATFAGPAAPIDAPWIVMRNRTHSPDHRPNYITLADEATGQHSDGSDGFVMLGG